MTFEEKLETSISSFTSIDKPDYTREEHNLFADFVELIALFANTDGVSSGDILDKFFGTKDYKDAEQRDSDESWLIEVFSILEERVILFQDDYPFTFIDSDLLLLKTELAWKNKLYLGLLISSKLNIFKGFSKDLTTEFETISYHVFKNFLPQNAIVKEFGKNTEYQGNAKSKIRELATDIGLKIVEYELEAVAERNNQERGLDIIGWVPFEDKGMNQLVYLAQCTCGKDTESKFHDTRRFENYLSFYKNQPQHIMFIPYSLINKRERKFYHSDLIEQGFLIFERKRILDVFNQRDVFRETEMLKIVDECILYVADIV